MADALGTPGGVVSDEDHRIAMAGMIAPQTSSLAVRTGVLWGPGTTALVTGTSATGTMTYAIALHHAVTTRGTADGVYLGPNLEAATTVATTAAPGSNSRYDVIWVKQNDTASTVSADTGTTAPLYGVTQGGAAVSPTKPSIPVGAEELAYAIIAAGATSTNGANVTISNTARQTVARGARIPVRSQAEQDALTAFKGLEVYRLDTGQVQLCTATGPTAWATLFDPATHDSGWLSLTPAAGIAAGGRGIRYRVKRGVCYFNFGAVAAAGFSAGQAVATFPIGVRPLEPTSVQGSFSNIGGAGIEVVITNATGVVSIGAGVGSGSGSNIALTVSGSFLID